MPVNHPFTVIVLILFLFAGCSNKGPNYSSLPVSLDEVDFNVSLPLRERVDSRDSIIVSQHFRFQFLESSMTADNMAEVTEVCEKNISKLLPSLGIKKLGYKIDYVIYPDIETKGLSLQNGALAQVSHKKKEVYAVVGELFSGHEFHPENELILRLQLGETPYKAIEKGLAIFLNPTWQFKGYDHWAARLFTSGNMPTLEELLNEDLFSKESDLVMGVAAASFVDFLITQEGRAAFLENYPEIFIKSNQTADLQKQWHSFLNEKYASFSVVSYADRRLPWLKGFNFAHEGYRVYNGYGSGLAEKSMEKMISLGSNALAIVPYSFMRNDDNPTFLPLMRGAGSETDESVIATHLQAKKRKAYTVLKPQIWMHGSWPGAIKMKNEKDWSQFFDYYYRWMRHYALIAEIWQFDMLCVGVEFAEATQSHPEDWRELIRKLRGIYSGPMTYAANWGDEFERITFWDELDYIGLNCYYPLSKNPAATRSQLEEGFQKTIRKIEVVCNRFNKPLIFTEIGFRSVGKTWVNPHEEANGRDSNFEDQRLCYEIVSNAIMDKKWCRGILWWKWPSHLGHNRKEGRGFTPNGKPAQEVVKNCFLNGK